MPISSCRLVGITLPSPERNKTDNISRGGLAMSRPTLQRAWAAPLVVFRAEVWLFPDGGERALRGWLPPSNSRPLEFDSSWFAHSDIYSMIRHGLRGEKGAR